MRGWGRRWFDRRPKKEPVEDPEDPLLQRIAELEASLEEVRARADRLTAVLLRIMKLTVPPAVVAVLVLFTWIFWPERLDSAAARLVTATFFGKIAAAGGQEHFVFWLVVLGTLDVMIGLFFLWNVDVVYRLPWLGDRFREMERLGHRFLQKNGWIRRVAFVGVVLFIAVPVHGTGAITGSILGRFLGLGTLRTFLALIIGGYGGVALVLSGSLAAAGLRQIDPLLFGAFLVLVALALLALWWRFMHRVEPPGEGA